MSGLPTKQDLDKRKQEAQEKLQRLQKAYSTFIDEWNELSKEEADLVKNAGKYVDKSKMYSILKTIDNIKE